MACYILSSILKTLQSRRADGMRWRPTIASDGILAIEKRQLHSRVPANDADSLCLEGNGFRGPLHEACVWGEGKTLGKFCGKRFAVVFFWQGRSNENVPMLLRGYLEGLRVSRYHGLEHPVAP